MNMKPPVYIVVVALLLVAIFIVWPRARHTEPLEPVDTSPPKTGELGDSDAASREFIQPEILNGSPRGARVPAMVDIEVTPESPPEQNLEWQIAQQQAMLKALRRHIDATEAKWQAATSDLERQALQEQIEVLRTELTNKQEELIRLQGEGTP
jgi:hypothetical protein